MSTIIKKKILAQYSLRWQTPTISEVSGYIHIELIGTLYLLYLHIIIHIS